jgi:hypothetical protein
MATPADKRRLSPPTPAWNRRQIANPYSKCRRTAVSDQVNSSGIAVLKWADAGNEFAIT